MKQLTYDISGKGFSTVLLPWLFLLMENILLMGSAPLKGIEHLMCVFFETAAFFERT